MADEHVKVLFELKKDADGYPPVEVEQLWAEPVGGNLYKIDNVPFFVKGISCEDIVAAEPDSRGELRYTSLIKPSSRNTLRVIVFRDSPDLRPIADRVSDLRTQLAEVGCSTELSNMQGLIAVDLDSGSISKVVSLLQSGERANLWEYEEGAVRK